jgi:hypothetical protein
MGWRYRKSINLGPLRFNMGRRGVGQSVGIRGLRLTQTASGQRYVTFTVPGTGWSYRKTLSRRPAPRRQGTPAPGRSLTLPSPPANLGPGPQPTQRPSRLPDWMNDAP